MLLHTLLGRYLLVMTAVAALVARPAVASLLSRGALDGVRLSPDAARGALALGHLALLVAFAGIFAATLSRTFVLRRREEPLWAHPFALPGLMLHRLAGAWVSAALAVLPGFYLFHWHLLAAGGGPRGMVLAVHLATALAWLLVAGVPVAALVRAWLVGPRITGRARALNGAGALVAMAALAGAALGAEPLARARPGVLEALGSPGVARLLLPPSAAVAALAGGGWAVLLAWAAVLALGAAWAARTAARWAAQAPRELPLDLDAAEPVRFSSAFAPAAGGPRSRVRLFWTKDVVLPFRRAPLRALLPHWLLLTGAVAELAVMRAFWPAALPRAEGEAALVAATVAGVAAVLALRAGLPSLGQEGDGLWLLLPLVRPAELFACKLLPAAATAALAAALHGTALGIAARLLGMASPSPATLGLLAAPAAALFAGAATGLGFLLPDPARRLALLPGASRTAVATFLAGSAVAMTWTGAAAYVRAAGWAGAAGTAWMLGVPALLCAAGSAGVAGWALARLQRLER
jgi:hypothetical protein